MKDTCKTKASITAASLGWMTGPALRGEALKMLFGDSMNTQPQTASEVLANAREALAIASRIFKRLNANPAVGARDNRRVLTVLRDAISRIDDLMAQP